jgi:NAD(P)-dependent dehydrogenase (short-subunit alcohol dehydrogenase family)
LPGQSYRGFAEKVALVTDGASATGRAVALQLALEGAYVVVGYGEAEGAEGERVAHELREIGTLAHAVRANVWEQEGVRKAFALVAETFGRLDLLINSAHACDGSATDDLTLESWNQIIDVNLKSAFLCSQAAARLMRGRPKAAICNIAAEAGLAAYPSGAVHYVAAQAGLIGLTRALARAFAPRIRVNSVAVAAHESESLEVEESHAEAASVRRTTPPDEVARACVYLLSPEAGTVTGQTLVVGSL